MTNSLKDQQGIYWLRHKDSGRLYIGSSIDCIRRWKEHRKLLRAGRHHSKYLQRVWAKYGEKTFEFRFIHPVDQQCELVIWEQFWIDNLKPTLNGVQQAASTLGYKHTPEAREKMIAAWIDRTIPSDVRQRMAQSSRGQKRSDATRRRIAAASAKTWRVISPTGDETTIIDMQKFCKIHGLNPSKMSAVAKNKRPHHRGWRCEIIAEKFTSHQIQHR